MTLTDIERPHIIQGTPEVNQAVHTEQAKVPTAREINLAAQARAKEVASDSGAPLSERLKATRDAAFFGRMAEQPSEDEMRADMAANPSKLDTAKKLASQLLQNRLSRR